MTISDFVNELKTIGIEIDDEKLDKLNKYYELLIEWNEKINLTGITKKEDVYLKHFYDSLTLFQIINLNKIDTLCDIGTGAGLPGIVLKIVFPNINITLVDSLNKRINFLNEVISKLDLKGINTICSRIEEYGIDNRNIYDIVVARAVASLPILLEYSIPLLKVNGSFIAMKGNNDELNNLNTIYDKLNIKLGNIINFKLPFEFSNRSLIEFIKIGETNRKYPRKFVDIKNKPIL